MGGVRKGDTEVIPGSVISEKLLAVGNSSATLLRPRRLISSPWLLPSMMEDCSGTSSPGTAHSP